MALNPIVQPRGEPQRESKLDKILKGVQIAQGIMGTAIAIPKFVVDLKESRQNRELAAKNIDLKTQELEQEKALLPQKQKLAEAQTQSARANAMSDLYKNFVPASPTDQNAMEFEGQRFVPKPATGLNDFDKSRLEMLGKDFQLASPNDKNPTIFNIGGQEFKVVPRVKEAKDMTSENEKRADGLRQEFLKQSAPFIEQTSSMGRIEASAKDPSAAGDLALIFNYMKVLDPGSSVREGEFANAQNASGIPQRIANLYNQVMSGERLGDAQRNDFLNRARGLYKSAEAIHREREAFYSQLANERDLNPQNVVPKLGFSKKGEAKTLSKEQAEGF